MNKLKLTLCLSSFVFGIICVKIYFNHSIEQFVKPFDTSQIMGGNSSKTCAEIGVLSWNVWFGSSRGWDKPEKRWTELLKISIQKDPDVIGFQECTASFVKLVNDHTEFSNLYVPIINEEPQSRYFVMVFLKRNLKITQQKTIALKSTLGRTCEVVTFKKEGCSFRFGTVHVESYVTSPNIREIQLQTIFDDIMKKADTIELVFLVGDFNFHDADKENLFLDKSEFYDTWPLANKGNNGFSFDNVKNLMTKHAEPEFIQARLDRIMFWQPTKDRWKPTLCELLGNESFAKIVLPGGKSLPLYPSDHFGLHAKYAPIL